MRNADWRLCPLAVLMLSCSAPVWASTYSFQTYNNPADPNFNQLLGINDNGTIVGYFGDGVVVPNNGYVLNPPANYTAENFPSAVQTQVVGINNAGLTVGFEVDTNGNNIGFVKNGNQIDGLINPNLPFGSGKPLTEQFLGVNNDGIGAGFYIGADGNSHGFTFNAYTGTFTPLSLPASFGATSVTVTGINDAGVISGFYTGADGVSHGFIDNNGVFTRVDDPNALAGGSMLLGLNNTGDAVGTFLDALGTSEGFVYNFDNGTFATVNDPSASSVPAFGVTGTTINGINDRGDLVGFYSDGVNVDGFEAKPISQTPEPAGLALLGTGLGALSGLLRMRRRFAA